MAIYCFLLAELFAKNGVHEMLPQFALNDKATGSDVKTRKRGAETIQAPNKLPETIDLRLFPVPMDVLSYILFGQGGQIADNTAPERYYFAFIDAPHEHYYPDEIYQTRFFKYYKGPSRSGWFRDYRPKDREQDLLAQIAKRVGDLEGWQGPTETMASRVFAGHQSFPEVLETINNRVETWLEMVSPGEGLGDLEPLRTRGAHSSSSSPRAPGASETTWRS